MPFFVIVASPAISPEPTAEANEVDVFLIVNGPLSAPRQKTRLNTIAIAQRGFGAVLYQTFRSELLRVATLVRARGSMFRYTAVPSSYPYAGTLDFDPREMRRLFSYAAACAAFGELWIGTGSTQRVGDEQRPNACPANNPAVELAAKR